MSKVERGDDAQNHVGQRSPVDTAGEAKPGEKSPPGAPETGKAEQEAPNYETKDRGQAIAVEDMSSANDEGAN